METLKNKEYLSLALLAVTLIITTVLITNMAGKSRASEDLITHCYQELEEVNSQVEELEKELISKKNDLELYNQIYNDTASKAESLNQTLQDEKERFEEEIESRQCQYPYRSVPSAAAFGMVWRMELMLDSLNNADKILSQDTVREDELRTVTGYLYITATDFQNLFMIDGYQIPMNDKMKELYKTSSDNLVEISNIYHNFDEYPITKLRTRLKQLVMLQKNIISGMQGKYFLGN